MVPQLLKDRTQWLVWRFETDPKRPKPLKVPYYVNGARRVGEQGSAGDRRALSTFQYAMDTCSRQGYDGIGFAFLPDDGLCGIDLDGVINLETGEISERALAIVKACDSFTEYSPSGKGLHVYCTTEAFRTFKSNDIGVEVFCGAQYFTVTGLHYGGTPEEVRALQPEVLERLRATVDAAKGKDRAPAKAKAAPSDSDFARVNDAAMRSLDAWVPVLFPTAKRSGGGRYRVAQRDLGRDFQEDLSIDPAGIVDFGVADQGDPKQGKRSPIDLVLEWGRCPKPADALHWLARLVNVELTKPGARAARRPEPPDDGSSEVPPAVTTREWDALHEAERVGAELAVDNAEVRKAVEALGAPPRKPTRKRKPPPDPVTLARMRKRFTLIYGTETAWDAEDEIIVKVSAMKLAFGKGFVEMWLTDPDRRTVKAPDVVFDPSGAADPDTTVNLYTGMKTAPSTDGECKKLLDMLQFLCGEEGQEQAPVTEWVLRWIAYPLRYPGAKMRTAIVMYGDEGTGKNLFWTAIERIYGPYASFITQFQLQSQFNDWASRKLFIVANEVVTRQELKHMVGYLKNLVTEPRIPIETKNMPVRVEDNRMQLVFLSNELRPLSIAPGDRRYQVIRTPRPKPAEYYREVWAELAAGGAERLYEYLLREIDLGAFDEHAKPLETMAKGDLIEMGLSSTQLFQRNLHDGMLPVPYKPCWSMHLYRAYQLYCARIGEKMPAKLNTFSHEFKAMNGVTWGVRRVALGAEVTPRQRVVFVMGERDEHEKTLQEEAWVKRHVEHWADALSSWASGEER